MHVLRVWDLLLFHPDPRHLFPQTRVQVPPPSHQAPALSPPLGCLIELRQPPLQPPHGASQLCHHQDHHHHLFLSNHVPDQVHLPHIHAAVDGYCCFTVVHVAVTVLIYKCFIMAVTKYTLHQGTSYKTSGSHSLKVLVAPVDCIISEYVDTYLQRMMDHSRMI